MSYVNLDVMGDFFSPCDPIDVNVAKFLELSEWDLINVTPLFDREVAGMIAELEGRRWRRACGEALEELLADE